MDAGLPFEIAFWAGGITVGVCALVMVTGALVYSFRKGQKPVDPIGALLGTAVLAGVPVAIAVLAGLLASGALIALETPPLAYLFVAGACLMWFGAALGLPGDGMRGCTKTFAIVWSGYALMWSALSFLWLGGPQWFGRDAASLAWLRPLLVGGAYAAVGTAMVDRKKRKRTHILGTFVFVSAAAALSFYPIDNGLAERLLPASDWLRFPFAAFFLACIFALMPVLLTLRSKSPGLRRNRRRELPRRVRMLALLMVPAGFLWAAARALTESLA